MKKQTRAMNPEQKQERQQEILSAALALFEETDFEAVSMAGVAKKAGLAKGTLYLYFATKEALFLAVLTQAFQEWFAGLDAGLAQVSAALSVDDFIRMVCESLQARTSFVRLVGIVHSVLERNIDYDTAVAFKQMLGEKMAATAGRIEAVLPGVPAGQGQRILLHLYAFLIGLQNLSAPAPVVARVLNEPGLAVFRVDLMDELSVVLRAYLQGLQST